MSFFQWNDIDQNAGNIIVGAISNIDTSNLKADVESLNITNIPIHYHCSEDVLVDSGDELKTIYPDAQDLEGAQAFSEGDDVLVMYTEPGNKDPYIIGFAEESQPCVTGRELVVEADGTYYGDMEIPGPWWELQTPSTLWWERVNSPVVGGNWSMKSGAPSGSKNLATGKIRDIEHVPPTIFEYDTETICSFSFWPVTMADYGIVLWVKNPDGLGAIGNTIATFPWSNPGAADPYMPTLGQWNHYSIPYAIPDNLITMNRGFMGNPPWPFYLSLKIYYWNGVPEFPNFPPVNYLDNLSFRIIDPE